MYIYCKLGMFQVKKKSTKSIHDLLWKSNILKDEVQNMLTCVCISLTTPWSCQHQENTSLVLLHQQEKIFPLFLAFIIWIVSKLNVKNKYTNICLAGYLHVTLFSVNLIWKVLTIFFMIVNLVWFIYFQTEIDMI